MPLIVRYFSCSLTFICKSLVRWNCSSCCWRSEKTFLIVCLSLLCMRYFVLCVHRPLFKLITCSVLIVFFSFCCYGAINVSSCVTPCVVHLICINMGSAVQWWTDPNRDLSVRFYLKFAHHWPCRDCTLPGMINEHRATWVVEIDHVVCIRICSQFSCTSTRRHCYAAS